MNKIYILGPSERREWWEKLCWYPNPKQAYLDARRAIEQLLRLGDLS